MTKTIFALLLSLFTVSSFAGIQLSIVDIIEPDASNEAFKLMASDGRIYKVYANNTELVSRAYEIHEKGLKANFELSELVDIEDAAELPNEVKNITYSTEKKEEIVGIKRLTRRKPQPNLGLMSGTYISDFDTYAEVDDLFNTMDRGTKRRSQCYNRAHVWAWELNDKFHNEKRIQVGKIWLYFTSKFIKKYDYKWWFHIAPYLKVRGVDYVMDRKFDKEPKTDKGWSDRFIGKHEKIDNTCPEVTSYSYYRSHQNDANCYFMKTSVHFWQPRHMKNLEAKNQGQNEWNYGAVKAAYKDAMGWFSKPMRHSN